MSFPPQINNWRQMALSNTELRRVLAVRQREHHNRAVMRANMPKRGLDYERLQRQRQASAASLLEGLAEMVRQYAPEAES